MTKTSTLTSYTAAETRQPVAISPALISLMERIEAESAAAWKKFGARELPDGSMVICSGGKLFSIRSTCDGWSVEELDIEDIASRPNRSIASDIALQAAVAAACAAPLFDRDRLAAKSTYTGPY
ncbi:hypothetical protein HNR60_001721 [Rhodopseudomonas rhenobacensis]|uniref:Uncharacterized protein n=1 Tax=Rhodopseudomonas rhenobacensis TaxID=87461 RepID=A0A7W7Z2V1_9BRAD|nr:hypothetical protein [Rhodopseudomonas rhenobacensis]MBB5046972.1 hypothetical protein [Rhodopseudomonas rhenobacensis]